jgi:hypothetical protein
VRVATALIRPPTGQPGDTANGREQQRFQVGLQKRGARVLNAPANQPCGLRDFDVADLDGNMLFFELATPKS